MPPISFGPQVAEIGFETTGIQPNADVAAAQEALAAPPLEQDPKQDQKRSVEEQLAEMQKQINEMKAMINSIAGDNQISPEARIQLIQAALSPPAQSGAPTPVAAAVTPPAVTPPPTPAPKGDEKPVAESKQPTAGDDPLAALDAVKATAAPAPQKTVDPLAALDAVPAAPSKAPEQKSGISIDPFGALNNVVPIRSVVEEAKAATEALTEVKPVVEANVEPKPAVKAEAQPEIKVEPKATEAPKVETVLSPELTAKAAAIGETLAKDFCGASAYHGRIAQKAELEAAKVKMDRETRKLFNEEIARTFAEKTIREKERSLANFSEHGSGFETERSMRYDVMARILGGGEPDEGRDQAKELLKVVARERIDEILSAKSTYEDGPARVELVKGLAKRFSVEKPTESIRNEEQEIRESSHEEFKAVLGADISLAQKEQLLKGIVAKANKNVGLFDDNLLSSKDLAPIFAAHLEEERESSRDSGIKTRRARLSDLSDLADTFDVEDEPAVKGALDTMKLEISAALLDEGVDEILNDKKLSWDHSAKALKELRDEAMEASDVSKSEANRLIEEKVRAFVASREVQNLAHANEIIDGIGAISGNLGLSEGATEAMSASIREKVSGRLDEMLAAELRKVDDILLTDKSSASLDRREKDARSYIATVATVGDDKLAHEIKVRLGAHAVETILEGDLKNRVDFETRADEAEDLAHTLGIKDEASQVVARIAEKRFSREPGTEQEIAQMKEDLYELMEESYLRPKDTRDSKSVLQKDATQRLVDLDKQLDEKLVAMQETAREKARLAAEARVAKAYDDIQAVLGKDDVSIDKRIIEVKKIQQGVGLPAGEVKKIVEAKVDELAARNDRKSTANAALLARGFGVEML